MLCIWKEAHCDNIRHWSKPTVQFKLLPIKFVALTMCLHTHLTMTKYKTWEEFLECISPKFTHDLVVGTNLVCEFSNPGIKQFTNLHKDDPTWLYGLKTICQRRNLKGAEKFSLKKRNAARCKQFIFDVVKSPPLQEVRLRKTNKNIRHWWQLATPKQCVHSIMIHIMLIMRSCHGKTFALFTSSQWYESFMFSLLLTK